MTLARDRRGSSTALGYVLSLGISAILITGLIVAGGGVMQNQREQSARTELEVIGQTVADDLASAARLADCDSCEVSMRIDIPERVAGESYLLEVVEVDPADPQHTYRLDLRTGRSDVQASVSVRTRLPVTETSVAGGSLLVEYDSGAGTLEVRNA
ncbi:DUF7266 family protein [Haloplanus sp. C73]|uniref:DUF7266 family protein n=1 Tax=Haloplanus sp. C73 TaxID=3421641 RepID=UPI003EB870E1